MIRICPKRDAICPHGVQCPYTLDHYNCRDEPATINANSPQLSKEQNLMTNLYFISYTIHIINAAVKSGDYYSEVIAPDPQTAMLTFDTVNAILNVATGVRPDFIAISTKRPRNLTKL